MAYRSGRTTIPLLHSCGAFPILVCSQYRILLCSSHCNGSHLEVCVWFDLPTTPRDTTFGYVWGSIIPKHIVILYAHDKRNIGNYPLLIIYGLVVSKPPMDTVHSQERYTIGFPMTYPNVIPRQDCQAIFAEILQHARHDPQQPPSYH